MRLVNTIHNLVANKPLENHLLILVIVAKILPEK